VFEEVGEQSFADRRLLVIEQPQKRGLEFRAEPFVIHGEVRHPKERGAQPVFAKQQLSVFSIAERKIGERQKPGLTNARPLGRILFERANRVIAMEGGSPCPPNRTGDDGASPSTGVERPRSKEAEFSFLRDEE